MRVVSELAFKWSPLESEHVQVSDSEGVTKSSGRQGFTVDSLLTRWQLLAAWYITWSWSLSSHTSKPCPNFHNVWQPLLSQHFVNNISLSSTAQLTTYFLWILIHCHWRNTTGMLQSWLTRLLASYCSCRPVEGERRVTPDALRSYRKIQKFFGPCCLCPLLGTKKGIEHQFVEAAIYIPLFGRYAGEYVAECTKSRCGYLGMF